MVVRQKNKFMDSMYMQMDSLFLVLAAFLVSAGSLFLLLRDCKKNIEDFKISKNFVIYSAGMIILSIGVSFLFAKVYISNDFLFSLKRIVLLSVMWPIAYTDITSYRIPNVFIIYGLICRGIILIWEFFVLGLSIWIILLPELIASVALVVAALLCAFIIKNSIGFGDIKLFVVMGLMQGLDGIWGSIFASLIISFIISAILLISKKKTRKDTIPFGPALVAGTFISICLTGM